MVDRRRIVAEVDFGDLRRRPDIIRLEIREYFGKHQVAIIDMVTPKRALSQIPEETAPVRINWGREPLRTRNFYGYVNHHEIIEKRVGSPMERSILRVYCVGMSAPMRNENVRAWRYTSPSFIVKDIAQRNGFRSVLTRGGQIIDYWAQASESDFDMLNRLAKHVGQRFWVDGSSLYMVDPLVLVRTGDRINAPVFYKDGRQDDTLFAIDLESGSLTPRDNQAAITRVYGVDRLSGSVIQLSNNKAINDRGLPTPAKVKVHKEFMDTYAEANRVISASAKNTEWVTTIADVRGSATPRLGSLVRLEGEALANAYRGFWLVAGGSHVIERPLRGTLRYDDLWSFNSSLTLTRNSRERVIASAALSGGNRRPRFVEAQFRSGLWQANNLETVYV